jgi:hypothetical protein
MRIKRFNENFDNFVINPIKFDNSKGVEKVVYPSVIINNVGEVESSLLKKFREEMNTLMFNQGFSTPPKFIDLDNGNVIPDRLRYTVKNSAWVFFVEEKNLEKSKEIANKYGFDFYQK